MKITIVSAGLAALLTTLSVAPVVAQAEAVATTPASKSGHYEWRYKARPGANKSQFPPYERIWVVDQMALSLAAKMQRMMADCEAKSCCAEGQPQSSKHNNNS